MQSMNSIEVDLLSDQSSDQPTNVVVANIVIVVLVVVVLVVVFPQSFEPAIRNESQNRVLDFL